MIIRVFRPTVHPGQHEVFERFLRETAVPFVSSKPGLIAQHVGRPLDGGDEYTFVTVWKDLDSLKGFAGEHWQEAVIDPSEESMLAATSIAHFETFD